MATNVFAKTEKKKTATKPKKESTIWLVGDDDVEKDPARLGEAVRDLLVADKAAKAAELRADMAKAKLKNYASQRWVDEFSADGVPIETPIKLVSNKGDSVTFIVQDRTNGYVLSEEAQQQISGIVGAEPLAELLAEKTSFAFNPEVLAEVTPSGATVQELVGERIGALLERMVTAGHLTTEQKDGLFLVNTTQVLVPGVFHRLPALANYSADTFKKLVSTISGAVVQYIKA